MGQELLVEMVNKPLSPREKDTLIKRQNLIRALVAENPEFKSQVEMYLAQAQQY